MKTQEHLEFGQKGEEIAERFLIHKGYTIRERNWKNHFEEIDLIAENDRFLVVVEVKTRKNNHFGEPEFFVGLKKQRLLVNAADAYIHKHAIQKECRFDVISIVKNASEEKILHIENAFSPFD